MTPEDVGYVREAIRLAHEAERRGNLPIGAVIVLKDQIVATGRNVIWHPTLDLTRHAEMEALRALPAGVRARGPELTLYTTLEPCPMCAGAIWLHRIGRLVYGAADPHAGMRSSLGDMPLFFQHMFGVTEWVGPALPEECDPLFARVKEIEAARAG